MVTTTTPGAQSPQQNPSSDSPLAGLPGGAPTAVREAAEGKKLDGVAERSVLDWICGDTAPIRYWVEVQWDTPTGLRPVRFHMIQLDQSVVDAIEKRNRSGDGPFAELNTRVFNAELVEEATDYIEDPLTGSRMSLTDPRFLGLIPSPAIALEKRFGMQAGLLRGLMGEIRAMAGADDDRVGTAQRTLVDAVGNS